MRTRSTANSGTDSRIALILNQGGFADVLEHTFGDTGQHDLETGQANLYALNVLQADISLFSLTNSSIRIGIRGDDLWRPEDIFVWGQSSLNGAVLPLAIATNIQSALSTDANEGALSLPVQRVSALSLAPIRRLLMLMLTADGDDTGTNSPVALRITNREGSILDFEIPDTSQEDQESGQANWYWVPVRTPFFKVDLDDDSIQLVIRGDDAWLPSAFFLFGVDSAEGRPQAMVPLVHIRNWNLGWMSTDSSEGAGTIELPLS
jgi:hypothetical protein